MFIEDVGTRLVGRGTDGKEIEYSLASADSALRRKVARALSRERRPYGGLDYAVKEWMRLAWEDLAEHDLVVYEIAKLFDSEEGADGKPDGILLCRIPPDTLAKREGVLVQCTSERDQRDLGLDAEVSLDSERFAVLDVPTGLRRTVREAVEGLQGPEVNAVGSIAPWSHEELYAEGYRLEDHATLRDAFVARASRACGWQGRGQFADQATGHYIARRAIRFGRFTSELRRSFLNYLNEILRQGVDALGGESVIKGTNTLAESDYDEAEAKLEKGTESFRTLLRGIGAR